MGNSLRMARINEGATGTLHVLFGNALYLESKRR
jgi:hypothetical protein